ncbi:hypothetical protein FACS1894110_03910 [Spirochaetia bacterium]|nr:hypothetical protein FACS1894110_03910 [Spirochaetia bacterium]
MFTSRINAPGSSHRTPGEAAPGQIKSAGDAKAGGKTGFPTQIRPPPQLLTTPSSLLAKLGLPQDKLSASIIAFARYFSLPLESGLLTKIRRQSLSAEHSAQTREALSLAAAVALDKGVELSRDSLADYARSLSQHLAIDPDKRRSGDGGAGTGNGSPNKDRNRNKKPRDVESLRNKILQAGEQNPLINMMNSLPGKNGQRWMVFPFSFDDQGHDFAVTLRILLTPEFTTQGFRAERMALEIAGEDQHWLFIANNPAGGRLQLTGSFRPGDPSSKKASVRALRSMERELAGLLGLAPEQVQMRNDEEFPPFAPDSRDETLIPVNEEV